MAMVKKLLGFYRRLVCHPVPLVFALLFVLAKVWSNISYGGSLVNGLRSGLMGILVYALAVGLIYLLSGKPLGDRSAAQQLASGQAKWGLVLGVILYFFILGSIVDRLQRQGLMPGYPVFSWIPGVGAVAQPLQ